MQIRLLVMKSLPCLSNSGLVNIKTGVDRIDRFDKSENPRVECKLLGRKEKNARLGTTYKMGKT